MADKEITETRVTTVIVFFNLISSFLLLPLGRNKPLKHLLLYSVVVCQFLLL